MNCLKKNKWKHLNNPDYFDIKLYLKDKIDEFSYFDMIQHIHGYRINHSDFTAVLFEHKDHIEVL